jgi:hypothetical protein
MKPERRAAATTTIPIAAAIAAIAIPAEATAKKL